MRRSLKCYRGKEVSVHSLFTKGTKTPMYFADAKSPLQRGSNEHLDWLLRQYPRQVPICRGGAARRLL